jgi:CBS domain-containing protein
MSIRDIMSTDLVTISSGGTLQEAVTKMLDERVGSVVVQDDDEPTGIITETDVLAVGTTYESPFREIPVARAMSSDPVTIAPKTSVEAAVETMQDYGIKKLPVVEGGTLVGIVTLTDLVYHQQELVEAAKELERRQSAVDRTPEG